MLRGLAARARRKGLPQGLAARARRMGSPQGLAARARRRGSPQGPPLTGLAAHMAVALQEDRIVLYAYRVRQLAAPKNARSWDVLHAYRVSVRRPTLTACATPRRAMPAPPPSSPTHRPPSNAPPRTTSFAQPSSRATNISRSRWTSSVIVVELPSKWQEK